MASDPGPSVRSAVGGSFASPLCLAVAALSSAVGEGVLGLLEEPATYRLYHCRRCGMQVCICAQCDCGNLYCPGECAELARRESVRRAGARYQRPLRTGYVVALHGGAKGHAAALGGWSAIVSVPAVQRAASAHSPAPRVA